MSLLLIMAIFLTFPIPMLCLNQSEDDTSKILKSVGMTKIFRSIWGGWVQKFPKSAYVICERSLITKHLCIRHSDQMIKEEKILAEVGTITQCVSIKPEMRVLFENVAVNYRFLLFQIYAVYVIQGNKMYITLSGFYRLSNNERQGLFEPQQSSYLEV